MKHQYFGDSRDLFKYDLIEMLMLSHPDIHVTLMVPMLTPDDGSAHGKRRAFFSGRPGSLNTDLANYLMKAKDSIPCNCFAIRNYFSKKSLKVMIIEASFSHARRAAYFTRVAAMAGHLERALIFLDPDIGLEIAQPSAQHLLFSEVTCIVRHAGPHSSMMIYQHIPRVPRFPYLMGRWRALLENTGIHPLCISDGQIAFFFLCPGHEARHALTQCLAAYRSRYPSLLVINGRHDATSDLDIEEAPDQQANEE